ncbi:hypothetical protein [Flagellimonas meridianipacifica]|uniref:SnoaL-like protein n=1 Tax=Flagellimonas meridianipacifica TaxID=1080225 RepID=A0A2T0MEW2_9FLAO|nr:hypothetical protein [Allomuricauda pacifica]PRX56103.1 hypothetical protein CLV81_0095 [Allomuricauda pacifica]
MKTLKTTILSAITLLFFSTTTQAQSEVTLDFPNADAALKLAQQYVQGWKDMDVSKLQKNLADKAMIYGLGAGNDSLNVAQHKDFLKESMKTYTYELTSELYLPVKVTNNWNEGEWVLCWGLNTITHKETGKKSPVRYHTAILTENGKEIVGVYYYYDTGDVMRSQGFTITPPGK